MGLKAWFLFVWLVVCIRNSSNGVGKSMLD